MFHLFSYVYFNRIFQMSSQIDKTMAGSHQVDNKLPPSCLSRKRKADFDDNISNIAVKITHVMSNSATPKTAVAILNETYRGLDIKIVNQKGPVHAPTFTAVVEINGITYEGIGRSKKVAKHNAAEAALKSLVQFKNPSSEAPQLGGEIEQVDFTSDVLCKDINNFDISKAQGSSIIIPSNGTSKNCLSITKLSKKGTKSYAIDKNPVMLLNELHPDAKYEIVSENGEQSCKYTAAVTINGQRFEEKGSSKKLSKAAAARSALLSFHNLSVPSLPNPVVNVLMGDPSVSQLFCNHVSRLVNEKFLEIMEKDSLHVKRKVLAGFILSEGYQLETCKVISVSTGTKCVNGERMSFNGSVLNDSHAEIVARRCLCNFFYAELEKHMHKNLKDESIFENYENGFRLKSKFKIHLYINTAPCGDSRIFAPHECQVDRHPNRKARGQLRTKIECGEGTIPVKTSVVIQTWDGVILGERLLTMSCSDKIARWNVVGLQGALLANFVEPVYLDSIILGSLFHPDHLHRAVTGRIENVIEGLPPPYRLNGPKLAKILNSEARSVGKAPSFSVNWTIGDQEPEIINSITGRKEDNAISRLAKCSLFYKFLGLLGNIPSITQLQKAKGPLIYRNCKLAANNYQVAKKQLFLAFSKAKLGEWVKKPFEVDQFEWDRETLKKFLITNISKEPES